MLARFKQPTLFVSAAAFIGLFVAVVFAAAVLGRLVGDPIGRIDPDSFVPKVAVMVETDDEPTDDEVNGYLDALSRRAEILWSSGESVPEGLVAYLTPADPDSQRSTAIISQIARDLAEQHFASELLPISVAVGGESVFADTVRSRTRNTVVGIVLVALAASALFGWRFGAPAGLGMGAASVIAIPAGGALGARVVPAFDGSLGALTVPGALAALAVVVCLSTRFVYWFQSPNGGDQAEVVRGAIASLAPETALVVASMFATAGALELLAGGRTVLLSLAVAAGAATLCVGAIVPFVLAAFSAGSTPESGRLRLPDGRDLSLSMTAFFGCLLLIAGLFAFGSVARTSVDPSRLGEESEVVLIDRFLGAQGADPTRAIGVLLPGETEAEESPEAEAHRTQWATAIALLPAVSWVDLDGVRYDRSSAVAIDEHVLLVGEGMDPAVDLAGHVAAVVPAEPEGVVSRQQLATMIQNANPDTAPVGGLLTPQVGSPPETATPGSGRLIVAALLGLALSAAVAVFALAGGLGVSITAFGLHAVELAGAVGLYRMVDPSASFANILCVLGLVSLTTTFASLDLVSELLNRPGLRWATQNQATAPILALVAVMSGGLVVAIAPVFGGVPGFTGFGIGLILSCVLALVIGVLILRPALLAQRASFHRLVRPLRLAAVSLGDGRRLRPESASPYWSRGFAPVLRREHQLGVRPESTPLESVFLVGSPVYDLAADRQRTMLDAGVRVDGQLPQLVSIEACEDHLTAKVAASVVHPPRNLIDSTGAVIGTKPAERRDGLVWLVEAEDGSYVVAESIELSVTPIPDREPILDLTENTGNRANGGVEDIASPLGTGLA